MKKICSPVFGCMFVVCISTVGSKASEHVRWKLKLGCLKTSPSCSWLILIFIVVSHDDSGLVCGLNRQTEDRTLPAHGLLVRIRLSLI